MAIAGMKGILARVVGETDLADPEGEDTPEVITLRVIVVAAALLLEDAGSQPVKELIAATVGVNAAGSAPTPLDVMQAFMAGLVEDLREWPEPAGVEGGLSQ